MIARAEARRRHSEDHHMATEPTHKLATRKGATRRGGRRTTADGTAPLPAAYLRLVERFRPRPIRSASELDQAVAVVDELLSRKQPLLAEEEDYLEVMSDLIERYEDEHEPIPDVSGVEMLRFLIEQRGASHQEVARGAGVANSTLSAVLNGQRGLTLGHIEKLAAYFGTEPAVFLPGN
jgi:HTH-type transcriptional regulator/antitoxin HigA